MRRAAARSQCANNLKQIALALHNYYAETGPSASNNPSTSVGLLPAGTIANATVPPERRLSWTVDLLPYLEQDGLYRQFDRKAAWDAPANQTPGHTWLYVFQCPDWARESNPQADRLTAYVGMAGVGADAPTLPVGHPRAGLFGYDRRWSLADVKDGTSNTLFILESARDNGPWSRGGPATVRGLDPNDQPYLGTGRPFGGTHFAENSVFGRGKSIGCQAAMADGSVRFLIQSTTPQFLEAIATAAGGEPIPPE